MTKDVTTRITFTYKGSTYKFMSFWVGRNDNSFYFHVYRRPDEPLMVPPQMTGKGGRRNIPFKEFTPTTFTPHKISVHESGTIHTTDKTGARHADGRKTIPFAEIQGIHNIVILAPKHPEQLVKGSHDPARDINLGLPEDIRPFTVQFFAYRQGESIPPFLPAGVKLLLDPVQIQITGKAYGLMILFIPVGGPVIYWPEFFVYMWPSQGSIDVSGA